MQKLGPKTQREGVDLDPAPTANQKMAEFVDEHDKGENEEKGEDISEYRLKMRQYRQ
jgi:hypothetical protein